LRSFRSALQLKWMRSSPSGPDPLDPGSRGFAHRGLHSGLEIPENTLAAFEGAIDFGAGIECDLRLTADDQIIVFHDDDARRLCASPRKIGKSSWKDIAALRVGAHPIPTLENLLSLVGERVPLLLEVKVERDLHRWVPLLRRDLAGYRRFGLLSFDARLLRQAKIAMPEVRRGLNLRAGRSFVERRISMRVAEPDYLGLEFAALSEPWAARTRERMPVYGWTIRTAAERAQAKVQADALIWEGDGRPRN
jgi:glycerophosphoryl diester phosphodiesterase